MKIISNMVYAGPCSAESREQVLETARQLAEVGVRCFRAGAWKPRTTPGTYEGAGEIALGWIAEAGRKHNMRTAVEVATPAHAEAALKAGIDCLWIGARTVTDPFATQQLADALRDCGKTVLLKNPITPDINLWCGAMDRLMNAGIMDIILVHRGFYTYNDAVYRNSPIWSIPMEMRRRRPGFKMLCDPSHIAGKSSLVEDIIEKAVALDFDGLFVEAHCRPETAKSDAAQQITPARLGEILKRVSARESVPSTAEIAVLREEIDKIDSSIIGLLARRMEISRRIGGIKRAGQMPVFNSDRYDRMLESCRSAAAKAGLDAGFAEEIFRLIHEKSVEEQF